MKKLTIVLSALLFLPGMVTARDVVVDVRLSNVWDHGQTWVEFQPDRGAYVALYASYSDGSVRPVYPQNDCITHWVDGWEVKTVAVQVPCGLRLEAVRAVASVYWFDPTETWVASVTPHHGRSRGVVVSAWAWPQTSIHFAWNWGGSRSHHGIRSHGRAQHVKTRSKTKSTSVSTAGTKHRWAGGRTQVVRASGTKSSNGSWGSGESKRRLGR